MTCSLVPIDQLLDSLSITFRSGNYNRTVAYAYLARNEFIQRLGLSENEVITAMRGAKDGNRLYPNVYVMELLFRLAQRGNRHVVLTLFNEFTTSGTHAWGSLFTIEFFEIFDFWDDIRRLEVSTTIGSRGRIMDIVLRGGERIELKNWTRIWTGIIANAGRSNGRLEGPARQLIRDLLRGPLADTFWVFSHHLPFNSQADFYRWFIEEGDRLIARWAEGEVMYIPTSRGTTQVPDTVELEIVQRNWEALKANSAELLRARVNWLSPQEIRSLRSNEEQISLIERMLIADGVLSPR